MHIPISFLVLLIISSYFILNRLILGTNRKTLNDTNAEHISKWGNIIIGILGVIAVLFIYLNDPDSPVVKWFWIIFLTVIFGYTIVLEWKYLKGSKNYIVTLLTLLIGIVLVLFLL